MHRTLILALASLVATHALPGQTWPSNYLRPAFKGTIIDSASGRPLVHATWYMAGKVGIGWTDGSGRYLAFDAPVGDVDFVVNCPVSRGLLGKTLFTRRLRIGPATDTTVNFRVDASHCRDLPVTTRHVELTGLYTSGFETSMLELCEPLVQPDSSAYRPAGVVWVDYADSVRNLPAAKWPPPDEGGYVRAFVRVGGDLTGPGAYGHLGVGSYQLKVTDVIEVRAPSDRDCGGKTMRR